MIPQTEYTERREQLMAKIGNGTAIFRSAPVAVMHNDVEYAYRQDSDFFYLTGFNEPEAVAVLAPHHEEHRYILFVQPKEWDKEVWTGYRTGVSWPEAETPANVLPTGAALSVGGRRTASKAAANAAASSSHRSIAPSPPAASAYRTRTPSPVQRPRRAIG